MKGNELNSVTLGIQIDVNSIQRIHFVTIRIEIIAINCFFQIDIEHFIFMCWSIKVRLFILKQIMRHFIKGPILFNINFSTKLKKFSTFLNALNKTTYANVSKVWQNSILL